MLLDVGRFGHAGGRGRAGDVGDRRDVVPVDAVADAEQQTREQDADVRRWGGGALARDQIEHVGVLAGRTGRVADDRSYRNRLQLRVIAPVDYPFARWPPIGSSGP